MTIIDLQPFCWPDNTRPTIQTPWTADGFTYATDGLICIRVPALPEVTRSDGPNAPKMFARMDPLSEENAVPLASITIPDPIPCVTCDGGRIKEFPCDECDGSGTVIYHARRRRSLGEWPIDCPACEGSPTSRCPDCDGEGISDEEQRVPIGEVDFQAALLRRLLLLPNVRITPDYPGPGRVLFDGGDGAIMPMRKK